MFLCNQSHLKKHWKQKQNSSRHFSCHLRITPAHRTAREKKKKWAEENKNRCFWLEVNTVHVWSDLLFQFPSVSQCHKQGKQHYWVNQGLEILTLFWNYDVKLPTALGWGQPNCRPCLSNVGDTLFPMRLTLSACWVLAVLHPQKKPV